jgi:hypothetical protein
MFAMTQSNVPLACTMRFASLAGPFLTLLMGVAWPALSQADQPRTGQAEMLCEAVYMPAQTVWPRTVAIEYDQRRIKAVSIDGVKVYTFNVRDTWILTSLDNERIQINTATLAWTSDFRGLATAQGRCDWLQP